jgi:AcrR family transcriptional regulator
MKTLPTQKRALEKRSALIQAAQQSFIEHGYENTTAKTIANRAAVATGTFYQYFDNKDDMLRVIALQRFDHLREHVNAPEASAQQESVEAIFARTLRLIYDFHEQDPELHQVLEQRRHCDPELAAILDEGEGVLQQRVLRFVRSFNLPSPEAVAFNLFAMSEGLVHRHVFGPQENTPKEQIIALGASMLASYFQSQERIQ